VRRKDLFPKGSSSSGQEVPESDRLNRTTLLFPAYLLVVVASPATAALAAPCTPARAGAHVAEQPERWRNAVQALITSTASPDQPWGCVGGEVDLVVVGSSGTLTVIDGRGYAVSREVTSPDDVAPLGEALLAKPLVEPEPLPTTPPAETTIKPQPEASSRDPRLLIAATAGPRYAGPKHLMWGSFGVLAAVPFRPWGGGVWLRYDGFSTTLDAPLPPTRALNVGAAAYWSTGIGRVEFRSMMKPSLAVVTRTITLNGGPRMPGPGPTPQSIVRDETELDFRVGAEARVAVGLTKHIRAVVGLDAEVSPEQLVSTFETRRRGEPSVHLPAYTVGLGLGVEVAVP
jgi:hypothetical protein